MISSLKGNPGVRPGDPELALCQLDFFTRDCFHLRGNRSLVRPGSTQLFPEQPELDLICDTLKVQIASLCYSEISPGFFDSIRGNQLENLSKTLQALLPKRGHLGELRLGDLGRISSDPTGHIVIRKKDHGISVAGFLQTQWICRPVLSGDGVDGNPIRKFQKGGTEILPRLQSLSNRLRTVPPGCYSLEYFIALGRLRVVVLLGNIQIRGWVPSH